MLRSRRVGAVACTAVAALMLTFAVTARSATAQTSPAEGAAPCGGQTLVKADGSPWQCTFDDEFDGAALDTDKWLPQLTAASQYTTGPTGSQACYVNTPANISVANGVLSLTVRKEKRPFSCLSGPTGSFTTQYTAGMVSTKSKFAQAYGRFEVRAKVPQTTAKGLQETLWLYPTDDNKYGSWPQSGEIDFAELYSLNYAHDFPFIHYRPDTTATDPKTNTNVLTNRCLLNFTAFNTFAVEWAPGTIKIYLNGKTCLIDNYIAAGLTSPAPFDQKFVIVLTQALGIGTNVFTPRETKVPATFRIDYVRAWS